jgi:hypothetical protein
MRGILAGALASVKGADRIYPDMAARGLKAINPFPRSSGGVFTF